MPDTPVLLTGFEPFRHWRVNSSWEAVRRFGGPAVVTALLPVDHAAAADAVRALIRAHRPEAALLTGLAAGAGLRLETVARGPGGGLRSGRWPFGRALAALAARGFHCRRSGDAGQYVCETTYFAALGERVPRVAFLHVPPLGGAWTAERLARAVRIVLEAAWRR